MLPFSWDLRGLPIGGSLDLHRPILPAAWGVIAPHPGPGPDLLWLGSTSHGHLAQSFSKMMVPPHGAGGRNKLQRGNGAAAAWRYGGLGCYGDAASWNSLP